MRCKPMHAWFCECQETHVRVFFDSFYPVRFVAMIHRTAKVSERTNRNLPTARNTLVHLLALYIDHRSYNAQRYRRTTCWCQ